MNNTHYHAPCSLSPLHYLFPSHYPTIVLVSFSFTDSSLFPPLSRSDRVPGDDGRGVRVGRPGWPDWPAADPPHLPLYQQRVCLLLVLCPGLQLFPLLPPGLWCGVRRQMSHAGRASQAWKWGSHDHCDRSVHLTKRAMPHIRGWLKMHCSYYCKKKKKPFRYITWMSDFNAIQDLFWQCCNGLFDVPISFKQLCLTSYNLHKITNELLFD